MVPPERREPRERREDPRDRSRQGSGGSAAGRPVGSGRDRPPRDDGPRAGRGSGGRPDARDASRGPGGAGGAGKTSGHAERGGRGRGGPAKAGSSGGERGGRAERADRPREGGSGQRLTPKTPRRPEPAIADGVTGKELDRSVWTQLRTLSKENAEGVAQHLVMVALLLDDDVEAALAHAETAVRRAGRVPAAREALGLVAYRQGDWAKALAEFRTVRRLSGSSHLLPQMVDAERALGRLDRALELAASPEARTLARDERVELAIVVSGIRRDLGQRDAAAAGLRIPELDVRRRTTWSARLFYAYAEALLALGDPAGARDWMAHAVDADENLETDAADRLDELDGVAQLDLGADGADDADDADGSGDAGGEGVGGGARRGSRG